MLIDKENKLYFKPPQPHMPCGGIWEGNMQNISLCDVTLQASAQSFSFKEKIEAAKLMDKLGVSAIELAPIQNRKIDSLLIKSVATAVQGAAVCVPVDPNADGIEAVWNALKLARAPRLKLCAPMSPAQMEYFWHMKPAKLIDTIADTIAKCRALCDDVEFFADDACRGERDVLYSAVRSAIAAGASTVTVCDAAGLMLPEELGSFIADLRTNVPETEKVCIGVQICDELSMAGACAVAAIRAGAKEIKVISGGSGIARIADIAKILRARGDELGYGCDIRYAQLTRITAQIERMCADDRNPNSPFDSGVRAQEGGAFVLSENDDRATVIKAVERLGYDLSEDDCKHVYEAFQRIIAEKKTISAHEMDLIVASAALQVPPTYRLISYVVNCGNVLSASAHMKLDHSGNTLEGISIGDGPIDAAFLSIEQIIGHHYELDDFQIQSVTEGREAMGEAIVRLRSDGKVYSGRGISTDIVGASIHAYINALNKIVYEEA